MAIEKLAGEAVRLLGPLLPTAAEPGMASDEWAAAHRLFEAVARPLRRIEEDQALEDFVARPFDGDAVQLLLARSLAENHEFIAELATAVGQAPQGLTAYPDEYSSPDAGVPGGATWQEPDVSELVCPRCRRNDRIEKVSGIVSAGDFTGSELQPANYAYRSASPGRLTSDLARRLSAPAMPTELVMERRLPTFLTTMAILMGVIFLASLPAVLSDPQGAGALGCSAVCTALFAVPAVLVRAPLRRRREERQERADRVHDALQTWATLYYCHRDDVVFSAAEPSLSAPSADMDEFIGL